MLATISRVYQCSNVDQEEFPGGVSDLSFFLENKILKEERKINPKFDHGWIGQMSNLSPGKSASHSEMLNTRDPTNNCLSEREVNWNVENW